MNSVQHYSGIHLTGYHPPGLTPGPLIFLPKSPPPGQLFRGKLRPQDRKKQSKNCRALRQLNFSVQMTVLTLFMLMQMPSPRDIIIYWPGPQAFSVVQKPWGWAHILVQKPWGARGGMVTSQIDTCITFMLPSRSQFSTLIEQCSTSIV